MEISSESSLLLPLARPPPPPPSPSRAGGGSASVGAGLPPRLRQRLLSAKERLAACRLPPPARSPGGLAPGERVRTLPALTLSALRQLAHPNRRPDTPPASST